MRGNYKKMADYLKEKFQFTPLHERQLQRLILFPVLGLFQFTPLHERQQNSRGRRHQRRNFNSRLCMRGNGDMCPCELKPYDFNSRLCMRGNSDFCVSGINQFNFNSRLCMRGNWYCNRNRKVEGISIHASAWEATNILHHPCNTYYLFQFTPLHERQPDWHFALCV